MRGMMDQTFDGLTVSDHLREMLANPDSENADVMPAAQQQELLFQVLRVVLLLQLALSPLQHSTLYHFPTPCLQIFKLVALGGSMCQPDDSLESYLTVTKAIYKFLVTVYKRGDSSDIQIGSEAFAVLGFDGHTSGNAGGLFTTQSRFNVCLATVSASTQQVAILHKTFKPFW